MRLGTRQDLRLAQGLVMTPQMQQAIKLLQLSNLELGVYVGQEIERNPLLVAAETDPAVEAIGEEREDGGTARGAAVAGPATGRDRFEAAPERSGLRVHAAPSRLSLTGATTARRQDPEFDPLQIVASERSLRDHLLEQVALDCDDPFERVIGAHLIGMIDEAGYLPSELEPAAAALGCPIERVTETLVRLQRFDPPGVFARDLRECLALQLADKDRLDPAMDRFLDHLELLARGELDRLGRLCAVDADDLADMIAEIKALDPKPGLRFSREFVQTLVPDIFVRRAQGGAWQVELNNDTLPRVLVDTDYHAEVRASARTKADLDYLGQQLGAANWLVRALDQRARTILTVAREIVRRQSTFLDHGIERLRPLTLRDVAEAVGLHESTVSRVTANKYVATPRGTFELKFFFGSALGSTAGGESLSSASVRHRIQALVEAETARSVLSDDKITELLQGEGIDIARRTVAKYREALRIPSSVERRRKLKLERAGF